MLKGSWKSNALDTAPDLTQLTSVGYPTDGDPTRGVPPTVPGAAWFHLMNQMRLSVIEAAGEAQDIPTDTQLFYKSLLKVVIKGIGTGDITSGMLASNAVTTVKLADGTVTDVKLAAAAVTSQKVAAGAILTGAIGDGQVTFAKLAAAAVATDDDVAAGTADDKVMTPKAVSKAISLQMPPSVPTGAIAFFAGTTVPDGWLLCNGANVSRTIYANLFAAIGTTYGAGDGSTTFGLPNLHHRFLEGTTSLEEVGNYVAAGLPDIIGSYEDEGAKNDYGAFSSGAFSIKHKVKYVGQQTMIQGDGYTLNFDAQNSNSTYGSANVVQPASTRLLPLIKA